MAEVEPEPSKSKISRAPVLLLIGAMALAITLVLLGGALAARPVDAPAAGSPGTADAPREVNVILRDYRFDPTPLYLYPGETVRLNVLNGGMVEHELVLGDAGVQDAWALADASAVPPAPFATPVPASAPAGTGGLRVLLPSGGSTSVLYSVPSTEALQLVCHLPGHAERGMIGQVTLVSR